MEIRERIILELKKLTNHSYVEILNRGNSAIKSALQVVEKEVIVPEEGGWLTYLQYPKKLRLGLVKIKTKDAVIDLEDLEKKSKTADALLYQNPGGYFAEQSMEEIYRICKKNNCLVILDVSGGIGTKLCDGRYADIIVGSFGEWKLVKAKAGGFVSCKDESVFDKIKKSFNPLNNETKLKTILEKLNNLNKRIKFLSEKRKEIINDLKDFNIIHKNHLGFVVIVSYASDSEKEKLIKYCKEHKLEFTECPRYIRINKKAISIEVKRLE